MNDDLELVRQYAFNQSEQAFEELVARYIGLVYSAALRQVRDPGCAEEITQSVFVILARKTGSLGPGTILPGWLYRTTRYVASAALKMQQRRERRELEVQMQAAGPETDPVWEQLAPALDEAMAQLRDKDRNAIVLRFFHNKSLREVGAAFGMNEYAAQKRVSRALEKLRKCFAKRGVNSTTAAIAGAISTNSVLAPPLDMTKSISAVALAKGAAASASTLTLAKGALKLMAWTKTKTIIAGAVTTLLIGGGTGFVAYKYNIVHAIRAAFYPNIEGAWEGVMPLGGAGVNKGEQSSTRVVVKLSKKSGQYAASIDLIDLGRTNLPVYKVIYDFPDFQLIVNPRRNAVYQGKLNSSATRANLGGIIFRKTSSPPVFTPLDENDFAPGASSDVQGYWEGTIGMTDGSKALPIDLKIAGEPDGTWRAEFDNPNEGANGEPATVTVDQGRIKLVLNSKNGMLNLVMDGSGQDLSGSWIEGGNSVPASFKRADYQAKLARQAQENFSFASPSDLQGHWKGSWDVLLGNTKCNIPMELDIAKMPDGTYSATIANLDQWGNESPAPASSFNYSPPNLSAEWRWQGVAYSGKLENGRIVGTWSEGGGGFSLIFDRTND